MNTAPHVDIHTSLLDTYHRLVALFAIVSFMHQVENEAASAVVATVVQSIFQAYDEIRPRILGIAVRRRIDDVMRKVDPGALSL